MDGARPEDAAASPQSDKVAVKCPHCAVQLKVPTHRLGTQGRCPACKAQILIQAAEAGSASVKPSPADDQPTASGPPPVPRVESEPPPVPPAPTPTAQPPSGAGPAAEAKSDESAPEADDSSARPTDAAECWFCGQHAGEEAHQVRFDLHTEKGREREVVIPRCRYCEHNHDSLVGSIAVGAAGGLVIALVIKFGFDVNLFYLMIVCGAVLGFVSHRQPLVGRVAFHLFVSLFAGLLAALVGAAFGPMVANILFFVGWGGTFAYSLATNFAEDKRQSQDLAAVCPTVTTRPYDDYKQHPTLANLLEHGWILGALPKPEDSAPPPAGGPGHVSRNWHRNAAKPGELFAKKRPKRCPVCNSSLNASSAGFLATLVSDHVIETGVQCAACGAWGCKRCAHHHHKGLGATTYTERAISDTQDEVFINIAWIHDSCCNCDADGVYYRQQVRWKYIVSDD